MRFIWIKMWYKFYLHNDPNAAATTQPLIESFYSAGLWKLATSKIERYYKHNKNISCDKKQQKEKLCTNTKKKREKVNHSEK